MGLSRCHGQGVMQIRIGKLNDEARLHDGGWPSGRRGLLLQSRLHLVGATNEYTKNCAVQEFFADGVRVLACTTWLAIVDDAAHFLLLSKQIHKLVHCGTKDLRACWQLTATCARPSDPGS